MDYKKLSKQIEEQIELLFDELRSGISEREDSRAFGAMIEKRITEKWTEICEKLNYEVIEIPGRRTIFDFACMVDNTLVGFDVKTKDLDSKKYSDGGVCAVGNLLKFMANEKGLFMIVEFGHEKSTGKNNSRDIEYIRVVPFHCLPEDIYRIENLGTGQIRLDYTINQVWGEIDWKRSHKEFFEFFCKRVIIRYNRVKAVAETRIKLIENFIANGYTLFKFK